MTTNSVPYAAALAERVLRTPQNRRDIRPCDSRRDRTTTEVRPDYEGSQRHSLPISIVPPAGVEPARTD